MIAGTFTPSVLGLTEAEGARRFIIPHQMVPPTVRNTVCAGITRSAA